MPTYLYQGTYTPEAWAKLVAHPIDLVDALRKSIETFGGTVQTCMVSSNKHEPIGFVEFPSEKAATAWVMHLYAHGGLSSVTMTPVQSAADTLAALQQAHEVGGGGGW